MTTDDREVRLVTAPMEARESETEPRTLSGYAARYDVETTIGDAFRERIAPGAFASAITRGDDVRALFNHDANHVLGRTTAGTLRLEEDAHGLRYTVVLPDTSTARDLWVSVQRGDISQSSFAFSVEGQEWRSAGKGETLPLRVVTDVRLFDVSPVTYPAYGQTTVSARALIAAATESQHHRADADRDAAYADLALARAHAKDLR